jgi:Protein of unknown function (DUF3179)
VGRSTRSRRGGVEAIELTIDTPGALDAVTEASQAGRTVGEKSRAYPLQILTWHEIVNADFGEVPVAVTFCPLCNTAIVFDRRVDGQVLDFGTTATTRR